MEDIDTQLSHADRILRWREVVEVTGLSLTPILRLIKQGHFPAPVKLTGKAKGWRQSEIQQWIAALEKEG